MSDQTAPRPWALVAGASSVIGREVARRLHAEGYRLILHGARHVHALEELVEELAQLGADPVVVRANLADERGVEGLVGAIRARTSRLDALCWLAASGVMRPLADLDLHHLEWTFRVTAGAFAIVASRLRPRVSVAVSSLGSVRVVPQYASVGAAKAALEALVRYLAVELAPESCVFGLRVGLVDTPSARRLAAFQELEGATLARTPRARLVTPRDVAMATCELLAHMSPMASGSILELDGSYGLVI